MQQSQDPKRKREVQRLFWWFSNNIEFDGYVPDDLGIGGGDYVEFDLCLDCGQVQGTWPLPLSKKERKAAKKVAKPLSVKATEIYNLAFSSDANTNIVLEALCNINNIDVMVESLQALKRDPLLKPLTENLLWYLKDWDDYKKLCEKMEVDTEFPMDDEYED